jgi:hypothetical protein
MFAPESVMVDLVYPDVTFSRNNAALSYLSWRYRSNSVYDPDPLLGSGSVPGYTFWATGYQAYLVASVSYDVQISNMEAHPVDVCVCPSNEDLGSNYINSAELFGNPHATQSQLSAKGGQDRARLKGTIDLGHVYGNVIQYVSSYASLTGTNPTPLYLNVAGVGAGNFTVNNGLDVRVTLTYRTMFFKRKNPLT